MALSRKPQTPQPVGSRLPAPGGPSSGGGTIGSGGGNRPSTTATGPSHKGRRRVMPGLKGESESVFAYLRTVTGGGLSEATNAGGAGVPGGGPGGNSPGLSPRPQHAPTVSGTSGVKSDDKLRTFVDYCASFPIDNPASATSLVQRNGNNTDANTNTRGNKQAQLEQEILQYEAEVQTRKAGKEAAKTTFSHFRKQKIDAWLSVAERNNRKIRRENDALGKLAHIAMENCIDNDAKYDAVLGGMRANVELATLVRRDNAPALAAMERRFDVIHQRIDDVCEATKRQVAVEHDNLRTAFEQQVQRQGEQLARAVDEGNTTTGQWRQHNADVQAELLRLLLRLVEATEERQRLEKRHQALRVDFEAQGDDGPLLEREFVKATTRHQQLKERLQQLEMQLAESQRQSPGHQSNGDEESSASQAMRALLLETSVAGDVIGRRGPRGTPSPHPSRVGAHPSGSKAAAMQENARTLDGAQRLLETEASHLRAVRLAHAAALRGRTELEVYLRQAILQHRAWKEQHIREGTASRPHGANLDQPRGTELVFDASDRKRIVERLLSQERVLRLLYGTASPSDGTGPGSSSNTTSRFPAPGSGVGDDDAGGSPMRAVARLLQSKDEVDRLWERWKLWSTNAAASLATAAESAAAAEEGI